MRIKDSALTKPQQMSTSSKRKYPQQILHVVGPLGVIPGAFLAATLQVSTRQRTVAFRARLRDFRRYSGRVWETLPHKILLL